MHDAAVKVRHAEVGHTLLLGSIRLNIGAFFSMSGTMMNLQSNMIVNNRVKGEYYMQDHDG